MIEINTNILYESLLCSIIHIVNKIKKKIGRISYIRSCKYFHTIPIRIIYNRYNRCFLPSPSSASWGEYLSPLFFATSVMNISPCFSFCNNQLFADDPKKVNANVYSSEDLYYQLL